MNDWTRRQFLGTSAAIVGSAAAPTMSGHVATSDASTGSFASLQEKRRRELWGLLGDLPWRHRPGPPRLVSREEHDGYTLERLVLDLNGMEPVPALLLIPSQVWAVLPYGATAHAVQA